MMLFHFNSMSWVLVDRVPFDFQSIKGVCYLIFQNLLFYHSCLYQSIPDLGH